MTALLCRGRSWHYVVLALAGTAAILRVGSQWDIDVWRFSAMAALLATLGLLYIPGWRGFTLLTAAVAVTGTAMVAAML